MSFPGRIEAATNAESTGPLLSRAWTCIFHWFLTLGELARTGAAAEMIVPHLRRNCHQPHRVSSVGSRRSRSWLVGVQRLIYFRHCPRRCGVSQGSRR